MTPEERAKWAEEYAQLLEREEVDPGANDPLKLDGGARNRPLDWTDDPQ